MSNIEILQRLQQTEKERSALLRQLEDKANEIERRQKVIAELQRIKGVGHEPAAAPVVGGVFE
jgi:hypothetical protein